MRRYPLLIILATLLCILLSACAITIPDEFEEDAAFVQSEQPAQNPQEKPLTEENAPSPSSAEPITTPANTSVAISEGESSESITSESSPETVPTVILESQTPAITNTETPADVVITPTPAKGLLRKVKERGKLLCGVNGSLGGFSLEEADGRFTGFDVDFCRVIATAIFGNPNAVEFVKLSAEERFSAIAEERVDVVFRNTTWTAVRDTGMSDDVRVDFGPTIFHDGQRFMIRKSQTVPTTGKPVTDIVDLANMKICVQKGTTTELNLRDQFQSRKIPYTPVVLENIDLAYEAYEKGLCEAITSDGSQLNSRRVAFSNPDEHTILVEQISREPLGPAFVEHDNQWRDVVSWAIFATIYAEELNVNSEYVRTQPNPASPDIRRLLGYQGNIGAELGLSTDFAQKIISQVGNYEEIYNRNLGPSTPYNLDRGPNKVWNKGGGGVLTSPPFR